MATRKIPRLKEWSWHGVCVSGKVYGHWNQTRFPDGKEIYTSTIIKVMGQVIATKTGSKYELVGGDVSAIQRCRGDGK